MDKNNRRPSGGSRRNSEENSRRSRRNFEEDYKPHYSGSHPGNASNSNRGKNPRQMNAASGNSHPRHPVDVQYVSPKRSSRKKKHTVGKILAMIQGILSLFILGLLFLIDMIPMKFMAIGAGMLLILWIFAFFSQFTRGTHIVGKIESVLLSIVLVAGSYYLLITNSFLGSITGGNVKIDNIVIAVLKDDPAQSIGDAADYTFGIQTSIDGEKIQHTIEKINENVGKEITTTNFESINQQVDALYNGQVHAIIYNEAFNGNITENYQTFNDDIRILDNIKIETKIDAPTSDANVVKEPFTVYITGIDQYGDISTGGRSDVNILATVNPETKQILLTTTPRDYYVELPGVSNGQKDKLTHAGNYGVDCSMRTLAQLYGIDIDYYAKVNFTSVVKIVDELGGVDVYVEEAFNTFDGKSFQQGTNHLNGEDALSFSRERKSLSGGDNQRGKNQQIVMTAIIKKAMSPAILANYAGLLAGLDGNFETSMSMNDITELIKMQLNDGSEWNIVSQSVVGSNSEGYCYSAPGQMLYVMLPDEASVAAAKAKIDQVYAGAVISPETETAVQ